MGRTFMDKLWAAMKTETETDTLTYQVQAMKDIIDEVGTGFMTQDIVDALTTQILDMVKKSDARVIENNLMGKKEGDEGEGEEEDEDDEDDAKEMIKEENRSEYDLQLSISEIIGTIFKTHKGLVSNLLNTLFTTILPEALASDVKDKTKFVLFILDDMVEFLGPEILGQHYITVADQIIKFCNNPDSAIR
jgi:Importin repeat 6